MGGGGGGPIMGGNAAGRGAGLPSAASLRAPRRRRHAARRRAGPPGPGPGLLAALERPGAQAPHPDQVAHRVPRTLIWASILVVSSASLPSSARSSPRSPSTTACRLATSPCSWWPSWRSSTSWPCSSRPCPAGPGARHRPPGGVGDERPAVKVFTHLQRLSSTSSPRRRRAC